MILDIQNSLLQLESLFKSHLFHSKSEQLSTTSKQRSMQEEAQYKQKCIQEELPLEQKSNFQSSFSLYNIEPLEFHHTLNLLARIQKVNTTYIPASDINVRFCRQKENQKKVYQKRMSDLGDIMLDQMEIPVDFKLEMNSFLLSKSDLENIKPTKYLNGQCINFYLKLFIQNMLPQEVRKDVFLHNTYFMTKLLGEYITNEKKLDSVREITPKDFISVVKRNAQGMLRWTRNTNIFQKKYIIFPINLPGHWISIMVVNLPSLLNNSYPPCSIIYMDSLGKKHKSLIQAIRIHLRYQLESRKIVEQPTQFQITKDNLPDYQILLPRQTNFHDCGPCTLLNVQSLLLSPCLLSGDFSNVQKRKQFLRLFPKSLIFTMRQRMMSLIIKLYECKNNKQLQQFHIKEYLSKRCQLLNKTHENDYDRIDEKEFKKFLAIRRYEVNNIEEEFSKLIQFYLDPQYNFFQSR